MTNHKRLFLATPITPLLGPNNVFDPIAKESITHILSSLRNLGFKVFCAIEREEWGNKLMTGPECTMPDYVGMAEAELVIAFPDHSYGVHLELGWASALRKPVVVLINRRIGSKTPLVEGLSTLTPSTTIVYESTSVLPSIEEWNTNCLPKIVEYFETNLSQESENICGKQI